jgi:hypothetical protein
MIVPASTLLCGCSFLGCSNGITCHRLHVLMVRLLSFCSAKKKVTKKKAALRACGSAGARGQRCVLCCVMQNTIRRCAGFPTQLEEEARSASGLGALYHSSGSSWRKNARSLFHPLHYSQLCTHDTDTIPANNRSHPYLSHRIFLWPAQCSGL